MRWLALAAVLAVAWVLAGCGSEPAAPLTPVPTTLAAATEALPPTVSSKATPSPQPSPTPPPTATSTPLPTATGVPTPSPVPTLSPTPLPLLSPEEGQPLSISLGWQFNANGHLTAGASMQIGGRLVYLLSSLGRTVYAVTEDGQAVWQARTRGPVYALTVVDGDRIATGDDAGYVTLFDARGQRLWQLGVGSRVTSLEGWLDGLLAGGWDEALTFLGLDADGGQLRWQADLDGPVSAIATLPDLALAATLDGRVQAWNAAGTEVWRVDAGVPVVGLGTVEGPEGPLVLAGLQDGRLLALDAGGRPLWEQTPGVEPEGSPIWAAADLDGDAVADIIAGWGGDSPVLALLSSDGQVAWRVALTSPVQAVAVTDLDGDGEDEIVAGLASGEVQAFDAEGRIRASVHAGLPVWGFEVARGRSTASAAGDPVLIRADVVAWRLGKGAGSAGGPWLSPPAMLEAAPDPLPPPVQRKEGEAILVFVGDVAPGRSMEAQLARYGPGYPWQEIGPLLQEADLAVVNLEGVLTSQGSPLNKPYVIRAHPRWGQILAAGGFGLATVANNHALDFGEEGLDETLDTLAGVGIPAVGAGDSAEEAHRPALFTLNGVRVAVLAYAADRWNGSADVPATERLAWAVPNLVQADVHAVRDQADLVVVLLHAGTEYAAQPSADQVAVAHAAVDAGADLVVGHHPHVTQTVERYGRGLIVYSLGDTLFDIPRQAAMRGDLLRVHATREGLTQAELWPFWIEDAIRPRLLDDGQGKPRVQVLSP
jgi:poly-gamma-glutamate capsule biosynthesis protein CapA/YwtB (metallophosphatase superfamily)/outer membrane protein assembly factor BamB